MSLVICTNDELKQELLGLSDVEKEIVSGIVAHVKENGISVVNTDKFETGEFDSKPASRFATALKAKGIDSRAVSGNKHMIRCQIPGTSE